MSLLRTLALALVALAILPAAPALADQAVAGLGRDAPVAGNGGWEAWSRFDEASGLYSLMLRAPSGDVETAPLLATKNPWDVSLGPNTDGNVVAIYRTCGSHGCDIDRLNMANNRVQHLRSVSSPSYDEATPAIWRSTVVFTRRIHGCDVPYVKVLTSSSPSRRLLKSKCLQTGAGQASIRGSRILISSVDRSDADSHGAGRKVSELRKYSSRTGGSKVILSQTFGEEANLFGQVAQDARFAYTVRIGFHQANAFVRVPWSGGKPEEVRAFRTLTGAFAKPTPNSSLYAETQGPDNIDCTGFDDVPCRLVRAPFIPFAGVRRTLTPQLTVGYEGQPRSGQPLTFGGALTQQVVAGNDVVSTAALAGVTVELYHRTGSDPERFEPTGLRAVTGADGSYRIVLPAAGADPWYTAIAATPDVPTWAGRGTVGSVTP